jgi:hypothetical protein
LVVHRLMRFLRRSDRVLLVTKGDASPSYDLPIEPERVVGEVAAIRYRRFSLGVGNAVIRGLGWCAAYSAPAFHRARRWMRRIGKAME